MEPDAQTTVHLPAPKPAKRRSGPRLALWLIAILALFGLGTVYGFSKVYERRGEAALALVPSNAATIAVIDLQPSFGQYLAFRKISQSLDAHGFSDKAAKGLDSLFKAIPESSQLKPYIRPSMAFATLSPSNGSFQGSDSPSSFALISVTDPGAVENIIKQGEPVASSGKTQMYLQHDVALYAGVVDGYLLLSSDPSIGNAVDSVKDGGQSIADSDSFKKMRSNIDGDANIMVFVTKDGASEINGLSSTTRNSVKPVTSFAIGFAIRDSGVSVTSFAPAPDNPTPATQALMTMKPLRSDLYKHLPAGAYGLWAISDADKYYDAFKTTEHPKSGIGQKDFADADSSFQKEFGIGLEDAIHTGLSGDMVVALYPLSGVVQGADVLVVFDDSNGASPAAVAEKIRARLPDEMSKEHETMPAFVESIYDGAHVVTLAGKSQQELLKSIRSDKVDSSINLAPVTDDKTIAYATINNCVILSSSTDLLHRAIDAQQGKGNLLSEDPELAATGASLGTAQAMGVCSFTRIAQGVNALINWNQLSKSADPNEMKMAHGFVDLIGTSKLPLTGYSSTGPDGTRGRAFIPMDYDQAISLLGDEMSALGDLTSAPAMNQRDLTMPNVPSSGSSGSSDSTITLN